MSMRDKIEHAIQNQPCTVKELKQKFGGERGADRKVMEALDELVREAVVCQRQGVFFTVRSGRADKALLCKVVKLGKNFAFVMLEDGTSDIFIPGRFTKGAMPGDDVLVEKFEHPRVEGSDEGTILAILTEKNDLVGTVRRVEGRLRFVPDDCPAITMPLARDCEGGAKDGDKVAVEILNRGNRQEDHRVGVAMRFGSSDEAKRCAKALLYAKDIRTRFPDKVRDEAKKFEGAEVSEKDCEGRMDLRTLPIFTIDSAETKDIDDAISLTRTSDGGFELGVHIADVSNYVKPGTELDNEAFSRATSVYYADQVVPMLPKALSNGICSLNENELRLAFSCLMRLDKDGGLTDYRFVKSIIRSRVKGVYSEINALLAGTADAEIKAKYADVIDQLPAMKELYGHRARLRKERGLMEIEHVQRGHTHDLGLAALEDRGSVHARQDLDLGGELANVGQPAAVDTHLIGQDPLAHRLLGQSVECSVDLVQAALEFLALTGELLGDLLLQVLGSDLPLLLAGDLQRLGELTGGGLLDGLVGVRLVSREGRELRGVLARGLRELLLGLAQRADERLGRLQTLGHDLLGRRLRTAGHQLDGLLGGLGLDHHDRHVVADDAARDDHVEHGALQLLVVGEGDPLAVDQRHPGAADRTGERQTGQLGGRRRGVDRQHVVEVVRGQAHHRDHDLHLVAQTVHEGRAQRPVDQPAGQDRVGGRAPLAAEERAGDAARGVHPLLDVHGEREEVEVLLRLLGGRGGRQQHGVVVEVGDDAAGRLAGEPAGLEPDLAGAEGPVVQHGGRLVDAFLDVLRLSQVELLVSGGPRLRG